MQWPNLAKIAAALIVATGAAGCADQSYPPMSFQADGNRLVASGVIDGTTLERFEEAQASNPQADTLVLKSAPGSVDDEANLVFGQAVRNAGFSTIVPSDGMVSSGGTDLFLAGRERILESGACVGVHSWSAGSTEGKDVPRDDPEHKKYLDYYRAMGIAGEFYWFTLEAASAEGMHWMTAAEVDRFMMMTQPVDRLTQGTAVCDQR